MVAFVSEWRGYDHKRLISFVEAALYTAILYDYIVVPGALIMAATGSLLIWTLGYNYFDAVQADAPGITGPARRSAVDERDTGGRVNLPRQVVRFLDFPVVSVIVFCGAALVLMIVVPRLAERLSGER